MNEQSERKPKVLIVDDDAESRMIIKFGIAREGFEVEVANDGKQATEVFNTFQPDLIVLDLMMPLMDGIRFLHWLRKEQGDENTKVLIHTAVATLDVQEEAMAAGASAVVVKPHQLPELVSKVRELLG